MIKKETMFNLTKMFRTEDGKNYAFTFGLVSTLFLLWGLCNGMIDVMDKHFQELFTSNKIAIGMGSICSLFGIF